MVINIVFMLIDAMFDYLYEYFNIGNEFHSVMVIAIDYMVVDIMLESHFYWF